MDLRKKYESERDQSRKKAWLEKKYKLKLTVELNHPTHSTFQDPAFLASPHLLSQRSLGEVRRHKYLDNLL